MMNLFSLMLIITIPVKASHSVLVRGLVGHIVGKEESVKMHSYRFGLARNAAIFPAGVCLICGREMNTAIRPMVSPIRTSSKKWHCHLTGLTAPLALRASVRSLYQAANVGHHVLDFVRLHAPAIA